LSVLFSILAVSAAVLQTPRGSAQQPKPELFLNLSPSTLFPKDLALLEPHLGMETGCLALNGGNAEEVHLAVKLWKKGKVIHIGGFDTKVNIFSPQRFSISVREVRRKGKPQFQVKVVHSVGVPDRYWTTRESGSWFVELPDFESKASRRRQTNQVTIEGDDVVPVWAMVLSSSGDININKKSMEQIVKEAEWSLALTVSLGKK